MPSAPPPAFMTSTCKCRMFWYRLTRFLCWARFSSHDRRHQQAINRYHGTLNAFRPPGKVIPEDADSAFQRLLKAWAEGFAGAEQFMWDSANDWIPINTVAKLSDWEATLGLPDNCGDVITSTEGRRAVVVSRLSMSAGRVDDRNGQGESFIRTSVRFNCTKSYEI